MDIQKKTETFKIPKKHLYQTWTRSRISTQNILISLSTQNKYELHE